MHSFNMINIGSGDNFGWNDMLSFWFGEFIVYFLINLKSEVRTFDFLIFGLNIDPFFF